MSDYITSPNMSLLMPIPGVAPGPNYAYEQNTSLSIIDTHNHSAGSGVQVTPAGLNISSDLSFLSNNAVALRSVRFNAQGSPLALASDLGCLYESGVDLYYNDGLGNQIRITQSGGITGAPGNITGLVSPASVTYVALSKTFIFQSDVNTAANLDAGSLVLRNITASSNGVTLSPPSSLPANYTITLPALPVSKKILTMDASGNIEASYTVDNSTLTISGGGVIGVATGGITANELATNSVTTIKILDANVTRAKLEPVGRDVSSSCGAFETSSGSADLVTNLTATITTGGGPVYVALISDGTGTGAGSGQGSSIGVLNANSAINHNVVCFLRDGVIVSTTRVTAPLAASGGTDFCFPLPSFIDVPAAGTYTYTVTSSVANNGSGSKAFVYFAKLLAYELY